VRRASTVTAALGDARAVILILTFPLLTTGARVSAAENDRDARDGVTPGAAPLSPAERARNYRERKKREREEQASSGVQPGGEWLPAFPGQREPFREGNTAALTHGARSPVIVGELAAQIRAGLLGREDAPAYLRNPDWTATLDSWAQAVAETQLLRQWRDRLTIEAAATEETAAEESEHRPSLGTVKRRSRTQRIESVLGLLDRAERRAERLAARLGLDPVSRARMSSDMFGKGFDLALLLAEVSRVAGQQQAVTRTGTRAVQGETLPPPGHSHPPIPAASGQPSALRPAESSPA
jgi:hypothetical protein